MTESDCVFLSYDEQLANDLCARLAPVFGMVKRLHGVRGMRLAYRLCAEVADTAQFFLADGDFQINPEFQPAGVQPLKDGVSMRVWRTVNAVNGLEYGYGGLKLIRRSALRQLGTAVDVLAALPGRVEFTPEVAGMTRFNQSPFHAWRSGFRECAMLARGCEYGTSPDKSAARIAVWTSTGTGEFADYAQAGASAGVAFAANSAADDGRWQKINDPEWLRVAFDDEYGRVG